MTSDFRFLFVAAMYENGGNMTHRALDGHPEMLVYPFESQLGTSLVSDWLSSMFPKKYRWPVFSLSASSKQDYRAIIDEEGKVRARTPHVSKFRHVAFDMNDDERCEIYQSLVESTGRSRPNNVAAFFRATFRAWKNFAGPSDGVYVGYSPIVVVDAASIVGELPAAHVLHVVRNPWSGYADTKKRPVPMALKDYVFAWSVNQQHALAYRDAFPGRVHIVRAEDVMEDAVGALTPICEALGIEPADTLRTPSWNGEALEEIYPWGTIRSGTTDANRATADELSEAERAQVRAWSAPYLDRFGYENYL